VKLDMNSMPLVTTSSYFKIPYDQVHQLKYRTNLACGHNTSAISVQECRHSMWSVVINAFIKVILRGNGK